MTEKGTLYALRCVEALTSSRADLLGLSEHVLDSFVETGHLQRRYKSKRRGPDGDFVLGPASYSLAPKGERFLADNGGPFPYSAAWRKGAEQRKEERKRMRGAPA